MPLWSVTGILYTKAVRSIGGAELLDPMPEWNKKSKISIDICFINLWGVFQEEKKYKKDRERRLWVKASQEKSRSSLNETAFIGLINIFKVLCSVHCTKICIQHWAKDFSFLYAKWIYEENATGDKSQKEFNFDVLCKISLPFPLQANFTSAGTQGFFLDIWPYINVKQDWDMTTGYGLA